MADCICVNTLSELATISIPTGTQAAVVNQFNSTSAVSAALYILVASNPGHPLSIQAPGGSGAPWWTIHPDYVSLEAAGAPPPSGDCAPAMKNVLSYFAAVDRVVLHLWERDYILNSLSSVTAPAKAGFTVLGKGRAVSRLVVPYPTNTAGALAVQFVDAVSQYLLRDFSVISTGATGTTAVNCGTAISMTFALGLSPDSGHCGIVEHVFVGPEIDPVSGNGAAYFSTGADLTGTPLPVVFDTTINGCMGPFHKDMYADTSPRYAAQVLLRIDECYDPHILASSFQHATTAISYQCQHAQVQSFLFDGVEVEGVQTGLLVRHFSQCPDGQLRNTFCQYRNVGFDLGNIFKWRITGGTFRVEGLQAAAYDIRFIAASVVTVAINTFESGDTGSTAQGRINILIDAQTVSYNQSGGSNILIDTNVMGDFVRNPDVFATSAVQVTAGAQNIRIGASNVLNGPFSGPVVEDFAGAVTTQVGFPTSNNPANPAAVLPNGNVAIGQPTLGTNTAPWPATFSDGYTLPQAIPKIAPISGWKFYVDINDGNKLKAIYSTGTVVTLGTP